MDLFGKIICSILVIALTMVVLAFTLGFIWELVSEWLVSRENKAFFKLDEENRKLKEENEIIMRNADGIAHDNVKLMKRVKELEKKLGME